MPTDSPSVSILIVNYNTKQLTLDCLASVYAETKTARFETILVDNASADSTADAVATHYPQVKLIRSPANVGFGPANNIAARVATGRYVLLLNSDTVVKDGAIDKLVAFADQTPKALIWGGRTVFDDGTLNPGSCFRHMNNWSLFCHATGLTWAFKHSDLFNRENYGGWDRSTRRDVGFVSGCFLLITRKLWNDLQGFDERFFMYAEEADLCFRANALGAKPVVTPEATIVHYGGKSAKVREDRLIRLFAGRMTFMMKHWSSGALRMGRTLMLLHCRLRALAETLRGANRAKPWSSVLARRAEWETGYPEKQR